MNKLKRRIITTLTAFAIVVGILVPATPAYAVDIISKGCDGPGAGTAVCKSKSDDAPSMMKTVINIMFYLLGIIAVIMIIVGGIRYTTSNGDPGAVKGAKDTILYSVIGLIIAILSFAIVNFLLARLK